MARFLTPSFSCKRNLVDVSNIFQVFRNEKVHEIISWPSVCRLKVDNSYTLIDKTIQYSSFVYD